MARPTSLTPEVHERLVMLTRAGNYLETATASAGVETDSVRNWMRRGSKERARRLKGLNPKRDEDVFVAFSFDMDAAMADAEAGPVATLATIARDTKHKDAVKGATEFLKRRFPKKWGDRYHLHLEEELGVFLDVLAEELDEKTYERVLRAYHEKARS